MLLFPSLERTEELLRALEGPGYQVRRVSRVAPSRRFTYCDSWNGELRCRGYHFRKEEGRGRWELLTEGALVASATGTDRPASARHGLEDRLAVLVRGNPFIFHLALDVSRSRVRSHGLLKNSTASKTGSVAFSRSTRASRLMSPQTTPLGIPPPGRGIPGVAAAPVQRSAMTWVLSMPLCLATAPIIAFNVPARTFG